MSESVLSGVVTCLQADEKAELSSRAKGDVVLGLLPLVDNFELARTQVKAETEAEQKINNSYQVGWAHTWAAFAPQCAVCAAMCCQQLHACVRGCECRRRGCSLCWWDVKNFKRGVQPHRSGVCCLPRDESMAVPKEAASLVPAPLPSCSSACSLLCGSLHFACLLTGPVQADG